MEHVRIPIEESITFQIAEPQAKGVPYGDLETVTIPADVLGCPCGGNIIVGCMRKEEQAIETKISCDQCGAKHEFEVRPAEDNPDFKYAGFDRALIQIISSFRVMVGDVIARTLAENVAPPTQLTVGDMERLGITPSDVRSGCITAENIHAAYRAMCGRGQSASRDMAELLEGSMRRSQYYHDFGPMASLSEEKEIHPPQQGRMTDGEMEAEIARGGGVLGSGKSLSPKKEWEHEFCDVLSEILGCEVPPDPAWETAPTMKCVKATSARAGLEPGALKRELAVAVAERVALRDPEALAAKLLERWKRVRTIPGMIAKGFVVAEEER